MPALAAVHVEPVSWTFLVAVGVAVLAGALRGFSGFGSGLVLAPSLSALYSPELAVPVVLIVDATLSVPLVAPALPLADRRVALLCAAAVVTIPFGAWLLVAMGERALRWMICGVVLVAVALLAAGLRRRRAPHPATTAAAGALSGLLSGSTGMSGPPVLLLYLSGADPVERIRASFIVYFSWVGAVSLIALAVGGAIEASALVLAAALVGPFLAAALGGARLFSATGEGPYRRLALAVLAVVAVASLPL